MRRSMLSLLLSATVAAGVLTGCGGNSTPVATTAAAEGAGKVLNIAAWNEEFKSRLIDHYPGYEEVDGTTGKIGDITVK